MAVEESEQGRDGAKCAKHANVGPLIKPRVPAHDEMKPRLVAVLLAAHAQSNVIDRQARSYDAGGTTSRTT